MAGQRRPNLPPQTRVNQVLHLAGKLECGHSLQIDRPNMVAKDDRIFGLAGVALRDGDFPRVSDLPGGNRADGRHAGTMEGFVGHGKGPPLAGLFVDLPSVRNQPQRWPNEGASRSLWPTRRIIKDLREKAQLSFEASVLARLGPQRRFFAITYFLVQTLDGKFDDPVLGVREVLMPGDEPDVFNGFAAEVVRSLGLGGHGRHASTHVVDVDDSGDIGRTIGVYPPDPARFLSWPRPRARRSTTSS